MGIILVSQIVAWSTFYLFKMHSIVFSNCLTSFMVEAYIKRCDF